MLIRTFAVASCAILMTIARCAATTLFVSATGTGTACSKTAPCASINTALFNAAQPGDTVICLTAPEGDAIRITKSITIDCTGAGGHVRDSFYSLDIGSTSVNVGVQISIPPSSNDPLRTVRLRGLNVTGDGFLSGNSYLNVLDRGINIDAASAVYIEDCVVENVKLQGIYDARTGGQTKLFVKNTTISGNGGPGILAASAATGITVLDNVSLLNNKYGLAAAAGNNVVISRSVISGNTQAGVEADPGAKVNVSNSVISHNNVGVQAFGTVRLRENEIEFSNTAIQGASNSFGANRISGNSAVGTTPSLVSGAPADLFN